MSPTRNAQAMLRPCVGLMFVGAGFGMLLEKIGAPTFLWYSFGAAGLLALVIGVVYLLPFPLPRFADPYYQYLKRHGLLDATGKPLPDADIERIKLGQVPQTLLADSVHYTAATKTVIGTMLYKKMIELGILEP